MENQIVVFELENEYYGVNIAAVESIIKMQAITRLPHSPEFIEGITNLRGKILPVVDLRNRFGMTRDRVTKSNRIIVISVNNTEVGMIVDGVSEVLTVPQEAIETTPPLASSIDSSFITGIAKLDECLVILLDLQKVLAVQEIA